MERVGIKDVAREAGASINTVSRALNDKPDVSAITRAKVIKVAGRLGYRLKKLVPSFRSSKTVILMAIVAKPGTFTKAELECHAQRAGRLTVHVGGGGIKT